jgi:Mg2+ and Co2+ transporter CorA
MLLGRLAMPSDGRAGLACSLLGAHEFARVTYAEGAVTRIDLDLADDAVTGDEPPLWLVMNDRSVVTWHGERVAGTTVSELATGGAPVRPWTVALGMLESVLHRHHARLQHIQATLAGLDPLDHRALRHRALLDAVGRVRRELLQLYRRASALHLVATRLEVCRRAEWPPESQPAREALREQTTNLLERIEATRADAAFAAEMHVARQDMDSNEAMKWLTVVSTAALPLVLVSAYYGMNFNEALMPELDSGPWLRGLRWSGAAWFVLVVGVALGRSLLGSFNPALLLHRLRKRRARR